MVTAKFICISKEPRDEGYDVIFHADSHDQHWSKYTPSGQLTMHVSNEAASSQFEPGKAYYLNIDQVEIVDEQNAMNPRFAMVVTYKNGDTKMSTNLLNIPNISNGLLFADTADGRWIRIPSANIQEYEVYPADSEAFKELYNCTVTGNPLPK